MVSSTDFVRASVRATAIATLNRQRHLRGDPMRYANGAERLLAAIGEPQMIDTAKDARLGRIFLNRTVRYLSGLRWIPWHGRNH